LVSFDDEIRLIAQRGCLAPESANAMEFSSSLVLAASPSGSGDEAKRRLDAERQIDRGETLAHLAHVGIGFFAFLRGREAGRTWEVATWASSGEAERSAAHMAAGKGMRTL